MPTTGVTVTSTLILALCMGELDQPEPVAITHREESLKAALAKDFMLVSLEGWTTHVP